MTKSPHIIIPAFGHARPPANMEGQVKHIDRRELLRSGGVAALAVGAAVIPIGGLATDYETLVRECAAKLLTHDPLITCGEWNERKELARLLQLLVGDEPEPWTEDELSMREQIEKHRRHRASL